jgi:4-hydroxy-tetrahydrodipicolinate reductase
MKIALLGYGKMGKEIENLALSRHHEIVLKIDAFNLNELTAENLSRADVAIDFSTPDSAYSNIMTCFEAGVPVVCGTTGWLGRFEEVRKKCGELGQTFFYASNFSLGMNLFFALNKYLAKMMNPLNEYEISIREIHHVHKLDAPSGTAITLANDLIANVDRKENWELNRAGDPAALKITAIREDEVPGTHFVTYDSDVDTIEIMHLAKSRRGLALGAILAGEFINGKKGVFTMQDMMKKIMNYELGAGL